jgi:1-acyl-sn-glycerol-3-phosphate acyltransferase
MREELLQAPRAYWYTLRRWWWKAYWHLQVRGLQNLPHGPFLLCANHVSHLDAPAILAALPRDLALTVSTAAAKDVFADYPLRDFAARLLTNALPIERSAGFARGLRELEKVLEEGRPMILFPEGRRSQDGRLQDFHPGAAMLSIRTGAPIVPVYLHGVRTALPRKARWIAPAYVRVDFGVPIDPAVYRESADRRRSYRTMTDDVRRAILALRDASDRPSRTTSEDRSEAPSRCA